MEIDLTGNGIVGIMDWKRFLSPFTKLESLTLADNALRGAIAFNSPFHLKSLKRVDVSKNNLSGEVDVLLSPALQYLNLSQNNFTSLVHFKFRSSQDTLEKLDSSHNSIFQDVSQILKNIPPSLKELVLTENHIHGSLPNTYVVSLAQSGTVHYE